ncbi:hypothetical protein ZOSMA_164G00370 [Zostera marina]|uniref:Peptidase M10 metallopeptidase domain-containing protein n=1 Tax=Zostera marina TaxID=29655 RepID=A0A0K9PU19_ZOSMR|nr:hypothetical protein ZOSMA_164G00370 [Zostera marina]
MSYLVFLGFFLLASIITSSGQTCNAVIPATARVRDVRRVKFYLDPSGTTIPFYIRKRIFTKAFDTWERAACVKFAITSVKKGADIVLQFSSVTGANVVATATAPGPPFQVTLIFDIGETWSTTPHSPPTGSLDLHSVALHLIGHGIGLEHIINPAVVMTNTILVGRFSTGTSPFIKTTLTTEDIAAAVAKYGPAC